MEKKINIAELLKDCPKGMGLNCTMYENVYLDKIDEEEDRLYPIICYIVGGGVKNPIHFTKFGEFSSHINAKCVIFPKGKTTWEGFHRPFKNGDIVAIDSGGGAQVFIFNEYINDSNNYVRCYVMLDDDGTLNIELSDYYVTRFATEEEKQKLFQTIKDNGYHWNSETKTLEKLINKNKFIIGTTITNGKIISKIISKDVDSYQLEDGNYVFFNEVHNWKLLPNKFDITTLKPFDSRVLVRDYDSEPWRVSFWGCLINNLNGYDYYDTTRGYYKQCIPYEGNEHLMGKTDNCTNFYKNWE